MQPSQSDSGRIMLKGDRTLQQVLMIGAPRIPVSIWQVVAKCGVRRISGKKVPKHQQVEAKLGRIRDPIGRKWMSGIFLRDEVANRE